MCTFNKVSEPYCRSYEYKAWRAIQLTGDRMSARDGHGAAGVPDSSDILVFGGVCQVFEGIFIFHILGT